MGDSLDELHWEVTGEHLQQTMAWYTEPDSVQMIGIIREHERKYWRGGGG